jgi:uncharacterized membrane protein
MRNALIAWFLLALPLVTACGEDAPTCEEHDHGEEEEHGEEDGEPTGATCPVDSTLTYDNFAKGFAAAYCTQCHSSEITSCAERHGATFFHDFDTRDGIFLVADHVDERAGAGPDAVNELMPPPEFIGDVVLGAPTLEERQQLSEWLACGAPE